MKRRYVWATMTALALAAGSDAGFKANAGEYNGVGLNAAETAAVNASITKLENIAAAEGNAQNKATMQRVIACLKAMLKNGQICKETGTSTDEGTTEQDGTCSWKGDHMNVKGADLVAGEPQCSNLADTLMHEGIHTIQWAQPGSPYGGTEAKEEWVAYLWGKYILQKRLQDPGLTEAQKKKLRELLKNDCNQADHYCALAEAEHKRDAKGGGLERKKSAVNPNNSYQSTRPQSGKIDILDGTTGNIVRTLDTLFPLRTGLAAYVNNLGREVIIVGACDANALNGAVVTFTDLDGDGLVDQASRSVLTISGGVVPTFLTAPASASSGPSGAVLWMLAHLPGGSPDQRLYYVPDINADLAPDPGAAIVFADGTIMPELNEVKTLRAVNPVQVTGSAKQPGMHVVNGRLNLHTFQDFNNDHIADAVTSAPFESTLLAYNPLPMQRPSFFDVFVDVRCHPGAFVQVIPTDQFNNQIGVPIGNSPGGTGQVRNIPLGRPLILGEHISLRDMSNLLWTPEPIQVTDQIPEILSIDLTEAMPGQPVQLTTRFVNPFTVQVRVGHLLVPPIFASPNFVQFVAPPLSQYPPAMVPIELVQLSLTSNHVGLLINGDCNNNGIADVEDVATGFSQDCNRNSIPDECDCLADFNQSGVKTVQDLFDFLAAYFGGDIGADINCSLAVTIQDIFDYLAEFFGTCP